MVSGPFTIGEISAGPSNRVARPIFNSDILPTLQHGDLIAPLNDYLMEWDEDCSCPSELEPWRREGDQICDDVVIALNIRPGQDGLQVVLDHLELPISDQHPCVQRFWDHISALPPDTISAIPPYSFSSKPDSSYIGAQCRPDKTLLRMNRHPVPTLSEGQAVFWRYSTQIFSALMHFSLASGFSAVRVVNVLRETNYLTGEVKDHSYKRLLETTQAILDYMNDMTPITGIGWKSAVRVRILHSTVRVRLLAKKGIKKIYDEKVDGIPINQEDLIATLGAFAICPLWSLRRLGVILTQAEEAAYIAVWRHIGYYLGISPERLSRYYAGTHGVSTAEKSFACITMHLFPQTHTSVDFSTTSTYRLLSAVSDRPPFKTPVSYHIAISRHLSGTGLANRLGLPQTDLRTYWKMKRRFWVEWSLVAFGRVWRNGWERDRVRSTRTLVSMIVCWQLGSRRTKFVIKSFKDSTIPAVVLPVLQSKVETVDGASEKKLGDRSSELEHAMRVDEEEYDKDELDPEVKVGPEAGKRIVAQWRWLVAEMVVVCAGTVGLGLAGSWFAFRSLQIL